MDRAELTSETLRALMQQESTTLATRLIAVAVALLLFVAVAEAVRRRKLQEELTPIWITAAVSILVVSVWFDLLQWLTDLIGAWTPSSTIFFMGLVFLTAISLGYAIRLSALSGQVRALAQEVSMMRADAAPVGEKSAVAGDE